MLGKRQMQFVIMSVQDVAQALGRQIEIGLLDQILDANEALELRTELNRRASLARAEKRK